MKKSILFGALAFFAISAVSIQNAEAQNPVKKTTTTEVSKKTTDKSTQAVEEKAVKSDDCCAKKAEKKDDCCAKKAEKEGQNCASDCKKDAKLSEKKAEPKPASAVRPAPSKQEKKAQRNTSNDR